MTDARSGQAVSAYDAGAILSPGRGYLADYDYVINPYIGCTFACSYCYAAFFQGPELQRTWGDWLRIKRNAAEKLARVRRDLAGKTVYLSSATDPYQPVERRLRLTRRIVGILLQRQAKLVVQTRSPLATRDIDLFRQFPPGRLCINYSITTDNERTRRRFEPSCPPIPARLAAVRELSAAGLRTAVTMTPLLPLGDAAEFARTVLSTGAARFVVEPFTPTAGAFSAGTGADAIELAEAAGWGAEEYAAAERELDAALPELRIGRSGFSPAWLLGTGRLGAAGLESAALGEKSPSGCKTERQPAILQSA